jgi:hypothetical protein
MARVALMATVANVKTAMARLGSLSACRMENPLYLSASLLRQMLIAESAYGLICLNEAVGTSTC